MCCATPFLGTTAYYTIGSCLWKKLLKPLYYSLVFLSLQCCLPIFPLSSLSVILDIIAKINACSDWNRLYCQVFFLFLSFCFFFFQQTNWFKLVYLTFGSAQNVRSRWPDFCPSSSLTHKNMSNFGGKDFCRYCRCPHCLTAHSQDKQTLIRVYTKGNTRI